MTTLGGALRTKMTYHRRRLASFLARTGRTGKFKSRGRWGWAGRIVSPKTLWWRPIINSGPSNAKVEYAMNPTR